MKKSFKKLSILLCAIVIVLMSPMVSMAAVNVTLNVSEKPEGVTPDSKLESRSLGNGRMKYQIPAAWRNVESDLTGIEGKLYQLNRIQGNEKGAAEQLYVFYFSNEKYLLNQGDGNNREGIEKAIIKNILPNEHIAKLNVSGVTYPTARIGFEGLDVLGVTLFGKRNYDYFDTIYKDKNRKLHNAEFVFLPDGKKGMCCVLYVFTDSVHKADIINMLQKLEIK